MSDIAPDLLSLLVCPLTRSPLRQEGDYLISETGNVKYPIRDGIPILLIDEAELPDGITSLDVFRTKYGIDRESAK
jgi:uncharacterized protein YbaR (Trm112 family)